MTRRPRVGLALGSGGARGWCHLGVLSALKDMGVEADLIAGCSMGALVGAAEAGGARPQLEGWARDLTQGGFFRLIDFRPRAGGLVEGREITNVLAQWGLDCPIETLSIPFTAIATNLETGREVWLDRGPLLQAVRASVSIPGLFAPQNVDGRWLLDGGLTNPVPISVVRAQGADVVIGVNPNAKPMNRVWHPRPDRGMADQLEERFGLTLPEGWFGKSADDAPPTPQSVEVVGAAVDMMMEYLRRTRLAGDPADVMLNVELPELLTIEFYRAEEAIDAGRSVTEAAEADIRRALDLAAGRV